jgi:hypothetical protein
MPPYIPSASEPVFFIDITYMTVRKAKEHLARVRDEIAKQMTQRFVIIGEYDQSV